MFRISIACSELASAIRRVAFVMPAGIPAEPPAPDRRVREILLVKVRIGAKGEELRLSKYGLLCPAKRDLHTWRPLWITSCGQELLDRA